EKIGKINNIDFSDCSDDDKYIKTVDRDQHGLALLTGTLSLDIRKIVDITNTVRRNNENVKIIIGGLGPTLDLYAVALSTKAHIFIGESEGTMSTVMQVVNQAKPQEHFIFHRGLPAHITSQDPYVLIPDVTHDGLVHAYLNVPPLVNLDEYYSPEKEKAGNLANRMRLESAMLPEIELFGKKYDPPEWLLNQLCASVGCPLGCPFCSTGVAHGPTTRRMPLESLELRINASLGKGFVVLDQNLGAINHNESGPDWSKWMKGFFGLLNKADKRIFYQTDASFFDRVGRDAELLKMARNVSSAILIGVEQPIPIKGATVKDPKLLHERLKVARKMQTMLIATVVVGMLQRFTKGEAPVNPNDTVNISTAEWNDFLRELDVQVVWLFPFVRFPGATAIPPTESSAPDPLGKYKGHLTNDQEDVVQVTEIIRDYYSFFHIMQRLVKIAGYKKGRIFAAALLNTTYLLINKLDMSVTDYLSGLRK
ncbi:MAG: hypothetical protein AAB929_06310, partial [Patescibacteria group bacterium]